MIPKALAAFLVMVCTLGQAHAATHACAADATRRATKLLAFHLDGEDTGHVSDEVKQLPSLKNPASRKQSFDVLEVWGSFYKGEYRMRFIYAQIADCPLIGQEILEFVKL